MPLVLALAAVVGALALLGYVAAGSAQAQEFAGYVPANVRATNGPNPGEVNVAWDTADAAQYYRIGWIAFDDYDAIVAAGGDWLEGFRFIDIANRGQTEHTLTRLQPGVHYAFIMAGSSARYGTPHWSQWATLTLNADGACPAAAPTPTPRPAATPTPTATSTPTPTVEPSSSNTYGPGSVIPNFPTTFPNVLSGGSWQKSGGKVVITMRSGGYARYGHATYTCITGGCRIEDGRVHSGTIRVDPATTTTATATPTPTATATATPRPAATPGNVQYVWDGSTIRVSWDAADNADYYKVYYDDFFTSSCRVTRSGDTSFCEELASRVTGTSYVHTSPDEDRNYYWVTACNSGGCSALTPTATPRPTGTPTPTPTATPTPTPTPTATPQPTATPKPTPMEGVCVVGLIVRPGESCTYPGTSAEFSVDSSGHGHFLFFHAGTEINCTNCTINGVRYNFKASKQSDGTWIIEVAG